MLTPKNGLELRDDPQKWSELNDFQRALIAKSCDLSSQDPDEPVWHCMSEYLTEENLALVYESLLTIINHALELKAKKLKASDSGEEETKETDSGSD